MNFLSILTDYVLPVLGAIGAASTTAALLPKATPGTPYAVLRGILDVLGQNYGNAKNKP